MRTTLVRGMVVTVNLDPTLGSETGKIRPCIIVTNNVYNERVPVIQVVPITEYNEKKSRIVTNVVIEPDKQNGFTKLSVADCLQTRPIDHQKRLIGIIGLLAPNDLLKIDIALKRVFDLV
jgi:mRNA interferase MazF